MRTFHVTFDGHLTRAQVDAKLLEIEPTPDRACGLIVDARQMTGYDVSARRRFVEWMSQHRKQLGRVAVVTEKVLWRAVVSAMSLAASLQMKAFDTSAAAQAWVSKG